MTQTARLFSAALCAASVFVGIAAQAQDKEADAERLFKEAQRHMAERRFGEACYKFELVYKKDHQLGTLLNLAYCHKMQGAKWQAWLEFKEAELKAIEIKRNDRRDFARQRMAELEKSLVHVVVDPPSQSLELIEVLVEDRRVPEAEKGVPFAAEQGPRKVTYRAKGKKQVVELVTIEKGEKGRVQHLVVPAMEDQEIEKEVAAVAPVAPADVATPKAAPIASPAAPVESRGGAQRTVALVIGGVGVAAVAAGAVTGFITLSNDCSSSGKSDNRCPTDPDARREEKESGQTMGTIADISFAVGGAALVAAVILWVTAPSATRGTSSASVSSKSSRIVVPAIGLGWATLRGEF